MSRPSSFHHENHSKAPCKRKYGTDSENFDVSYEWIIHDFPKLLEEDREYIDSPTFAAEDNNKFKWFLRLYPKGDTKENEDYLSLFMCLEPRNETKIRPTLTFAILNDKQEKKNLYTLNTATKFNIKDGNNWGLTQFIKRDILLHETSDLLVNGNLILYCKVNVFANFHKMSSQEEARVSDKSRQINCFLLNIPRQMNADFSDMSSYSSNGMIQVPGSRLSEDLEKLLEDKDSTDVVLNVKGHEFGAHKIILCVRSPVLAAMFQSDKQQPKQNRVEITDTEPETFKEMLRFIYTGTAPNIKKMANPLLVAANKYGLDGLKAMCEEALSSNLSVDNASHVLVLAEEHNAKQLRSCVLYFVARRIDDVMATVGWKEMEMHHPELVSEVCRTLSKLKKPDTFL